MGEQQKFTYQEALAEFVTSNKDELGAKRSKKLFQQHVQTRISESGAKRAIQEGWDMDSYDPNCEKHCDHGINGYIMIGKDKDGRWIKTPVICYCVSPVASGMV